MTTIHTRVQGTGYARALIIATAVTLATATIPACGTSPPTAPDATGALTPVARTDDWPSATPSEAGLDVTRITDLVQRARAGQYGRIASLLFDYGYGWWATSDGGRDIIAAAVAMGQWILIIPSARLVVAVTGDDDSRFTAPVEFLSSHLLPSVGMR